MYIKREISTWQDLLDNSWSGATDVLRKAEENDMEQEVLDHLEMVFDGMEPTETELNDYIWHDLTYDLNIYDE